MNLTHRYSGSLLDDNIVVGGIRGRGIGILCSTCRSFGASRWYLVEYIGLLCHGELFRLRWRNVAALYKKISILFETQIVYSFAGFIEERETGRKCASWRVSRFFKRHGFEWIERFLNKKFSKLNSFFLIIWLQNTRNWSFFRVNKVWFILENDLQLPATE